LDRGLGTHRREKGDAPPAPINRGFSQMDACKFFVRDFITKLIEDENITAKTKKALLQCLDPIPGVMEQLAPILIKTRSSGLIPLIIGTRKQALAVGLKDWPDVDDPEVDKARDLFQRQGPKATPRLWKELFDAVNSCDTDLAIKLLAFRTGRANIDGYRQMQVQYPEAVVMIVALAFVDNRRAGGVSLYVPLPPVLVETEPMMH
jgi:hypothetical protein